MLSIPEVRAFVPLLKVSDMEASIAFYEKLGFSVSNSFGPEGEQPQWASLTAGSVEVMLGRSGLDSRTRLDEFYLYCGDVEKMHANASERGLAPTAISNPVFNPNGEFDVIDPDGRVVHIA
ncbi:MAG: VOC family protein [Sphingomonas sp.]|nr:VOC family protein [Sphingomonas sp.]